MNRSSFRYEVKVTTPHFEIATMSQCENRESFLKNPKKLMSDSPWSWFVWKSHYLVTSRQVAPLTGTQLSRCGTLCQSDRFTDTDKGDDVPTWVNLLEDLHTDQSSTLKTFLWVRPPGEKPDNLALVCISSKLKMHVVSVRQGLTQNLQPHRNN